MLLAADMGFDGNEQIEAFTKGDIAFISTYSGHIKSILDSQFGSIGDNVGYAVLPGRYSLVGSWLLAINANCLNPDMAFSFIQWITSGTRAMQCSVLGGFLPNQEVGRSEQIKTIYPWNEHLEDYVRMERQRKISETQKEPISTITPLKALLQMDCRMCFVKNAALKRCWIPVKIRLRLWSRSGNR